MPRFELLRGVSCLVCQVLEGLLEPEMRRPLQPHPADRKVDPVWTVHRNLLISFANQSQSRCGYSNKPLLEVSSKGWCGQRGLACTTTRPRVAPPPIPLLCKPLKRSHRKHARWTQGKLNQTEISTLAQTPGNVLSLV